MAYSLFIKFPPPAHRLLGVQAQHSESGSGRQHATTAASDSTAAASRTSMKVRQYTAPAPPDSATDASYTSMRADPIGYCDSHNGLLLPDPVAAPSPIGYGFALRRAVKELEGDDEDLLFLAAELRLLANAASDRVEMHTILAHQRDNWNKLFQVTLTTASLTACMLSGFDGQAHTVSLCVPALLLNIGSTAMMTVVNRFQPSQLAEEQRTAARLFRKLASHIDYGLHTAPNLRQHTPSLLRDCKRRLQALDKAFPMPLAPGGLERFPSKVVPPVLTEPNDTSYPLPSANNDIGIINGWDEHLTGELLQVAALLRSSDIPKYASWAQNLVKINKYLALAGPLLAASAALLNCAALAMIPASAQGLPNTLGMWAAASSVLAAFAGSLLHNMQLGMVFELYRNSAGYYADVEAEITETMRMPVQQRENGALFRQRVAYQLGRWSSGSSCSPVPNNMVPEDAHEAGTLF